MPATMEAGTISGYAVGEPCETSRPRFFKGNGRGRDSTDYEHVEETTRVRFFLALPQSLPKKIQHPLP